MLDLTGNALLNAQAAAYEPEALEAQVRLAERLLGVDPETYDTRGTVEQVIWAQMVALQVNFQTTLGDAERYVHQGLSSRQETYRKEDRTVSRAAAAIRDRYFAGDSAPASIGIDCIQTTGEESDEADGPGT